jgi:uncharacterized protein (TIGR01619 family)
MGFFRNLFSNDSDSQSKATKTKHTEKWATYLTTINESFPGSIVTDLGLKDIAPIPSYNQLLEVEIKASNPSENGLPDSQEIEKLNVIQELLVSELDKTHRSIFAGHLISEGRITCFFYLSGADGVPEIVDKVMMSFPERLFAKQISSEPGWNTYLDFLYPEPIHLQSIANMSVVMHLIEQGDRLDVPRRVDHWAYFPDEESRSKFADHVKKGNFSIEPFQPPIEPDSKMPYGIKFYRDDKVDHQSVDDYILPLWQAAKDLGGEYDGWETFIVK